MNADRYWLAVYGGLDRGLLWLSSVRMIRQWSFRRCIQIALSLLLLIVWAWAWASLCVFLLTARRTDTVNKEQTQLSKRISEMESDIQDAWLNYHQNRLKTIDTPELTRELTHLLLKIFLGAGLKVHVLIEELQQIPVATNMTTQYHRLLQQRTDLTTELESLGFWYRHAGLGEVIILSTLIVGTLPPIGIVCWLLCLIFDAGADPYPLAIYLHPLQQYVLVRLKAYRRNMEKSLIKMRTEFPPELIRMVVSYSRESDS